jgi:hypothetical protein
MKTILLSLIILTVTMSFVTDNGTNSGVNGKLTGVVTYKDSYELSAKADAGSKIYAISEADVKSSRFDNITSVLDNFKRNKTFCSMAKYNTLDVGKVQKLQENFDSQSNSASAYIAGFMKLPAMVRVSANKSGNYSLNLRSGRYYILVVSGSVKSNNMVESKGNVDYKIVDIKSSAETSANITFEKVENMMIMLLTATSPDGC